MATSANTPFRIFDTDCAVLVLKSVALLSATNKSARFSLLMPVSLIMLVISESLRVVRLEKRVLNSALVMPGLKDLIDQGQV